MELEKSSHIYDVQIGGCSLKLKTDQKLEKVEYLVQVVEEKVKNSLKKNTSISIQKALILSCLNIAEDYVNLKQSAKIELNAIESKLQSMQSLLKSV